MLNRRVLGARLLLLGLAVVVCLSVAVAPGRGSFPGTNGEIVGVGTGGLYAFDPDGTGARRIRASAGGCDPLCHSDLGSGPSWSPDGTRIVFSWSIWFEAWSMGGGVAVINADGSGIRSLLEVSGLNTYGPSQPRWSPDGTRVVFAQQDGTIAIVPASGGSIRELVRGSGPDWSPDGSRIAFSAGDQIHLIDPEGSNEVTLTTGHEDTDPSWSPDGARLAFVRDRRLWTMNADGSGQAQLLDTLGVNSPSWSPAGDKIAFSSTRTYTLDLATNTVVRVSDAVQPDWGTHPIAMYQTISFAPLPGKRFGDPDFGLSATASSGLAVSFTASGSCTVSGSTVHLTAIGSCTMTASQPGGRDYYAAANVSQTFAIAKASQTITFGALPGKAYGDPDFMLAATASSGLPVSFAASGNCRVNGASVRLGGVGACTITASQAGDASYEAATSVSRSFLIRCRVPNVVGKKLNAARAAITGRGCRTGTVRHAYSGRFRKGHVSSQSRRARSLAPAHAKINVVVSRGHQH